MWPIFGMTARYVTLWCTTCHIGSECLEIINISSSNSLSKIWLFFIGEVNKKTCASIISCHDKGFSHSSHLITTFLISLILHDDREYFHKFTRHFISSLDSMMSANSWHGWRDPFTYFTEKPICSQRLQFASPIFSEARCVVLRNPNPMFAHSNSLAAVRDCRKQNSTGPYQPLFATMLDGLEHKGSKQSGLNCLGQSVKHSLL